MTTGATFERERAVAIRAVREAADLCRAVQADIDPMATAKKDRSPVTVADFGSQALICRTLSDAFPDDPIVAEEDAAELRSSEQGDVLARVARHVTALRSGADAESICRWIDLGGASGGSPGRFWTLDPIDGTKGFLRKEQYAVALALIVDGHVVVAAMACPNLPVQAGGSTVGALLVAVRGAGATVQPLFDADAPAASIKVSANFEPAKVRFCESVESGHSAHGEAASLAGRLGITSQPIRLDSQAKYAVVARGEADIYLRLPTRADYREKIWDHAAGALILLEAGGTVSDVDGCPLDFTRGRELTENRGIVASNGALHDRVLAALAESRGDPN